MPGGDKAEVQSADEADIRDRLPMTHWVSSVPLGQKSTDERERASDPCCTLMQTAEVLAFFPVRSHWELLIPPGTLSDLCSNLCEFPRW